MFFLLFFPTPAIGAELAGRNADGRHQVVQTVVAEGGEVQHFADFFHHLFIILAVRVGVVGQDVVGDVVALPLPDDSSCD